MWASDNVVEITRHREYNRKKPTVIKLILTTTIEVANGAFLHVHSLDDAQFRMTKLQGDLTHSQWYATRYTTAICRSNQFLFDSL